MKSIATVIIGLTLFALACNQEETSSGFEINISVDRSQELGEVNHIWRFFGADEPNYAYMPNGSKLLGDLGSLRKQQVYFRAHSMLCTGEGTHGLKWGSTNAYTEDENGNPIYDWTLTDSIFDAYIENGVRPYVEIGFMPEAMSTNPQPYRHYWNPTLPYDEVFTGWSYPPKNYQKWEELVYKWTLHCVERYGPKEVEQWYWQTWNEANIAYWRGTEEEFQRLHDHAINGVRRALPTARVGGPDTAGHGGEFTRNFITHCMEGVNYATGEIGTPLDFISFHAKGQPVFDSGYVQMNVGRQLATIEKGFKLVASYPNAIHLPIVIGESDPEGCAACQGEQLGYRNGTMYSSYTAASFVRKLDLAAKYGVNLEGALTWAFEFENQPFFAGFRAISTNGINKPVYNVFKMFSLMEGTRIGVKSDGAVSLEDIVASSVRENPDVSAYASTDGDKIYLMAWHYHDDDVKGEPAQITFSLENLGVEMGKAEVTGYLVDESHSNSYTRWLEMGSPQDPDVEQYTLLEEASELTQVEEMSKIKIRNGHVTLEYSLERQGVVLFIIDFDQTL
jgi:xylan 1,4-beta-xylosidase